MIRESVKAGVTKINVNTENQVAGTAAIREVLGADAKVYDPRKYLTPARKAMVEVVKSKIELFGSAGKA
jgi:fructose-bisphosphate aldolase class II